MTRLTRSRHFEGLSMVGARASHELESEPKINIKIAISSAEYREYPTRGNQVPFCPSIGLPCSPADVPIFSGLRAWTECLRDDAWQFHLTSLQEAIPGAARRSRVRISSGENP